MNGGATKLDMRTFLERVALDRPRRRGGDRLVGVHQPASWEAERYRAVRRELERSFPADRRRVIGVTSAVPGEGKTTTSLNLAAMFAESVGSRVLLVDADLRCSAVAEALGLDAAVDLGSALMDGMIGIDRVTRLVPGCPFRVVPSSPRPEAVHELLESPRLAAFFSAARERFQVVLVDAPPILPVADCRALSPYVDGFIVVVAAHRTTRKLLGEALGHLDPQKIFGLVFNGDDEPAWSGANRYYVRYGRI